MVVQPKQAIPPRLYAEDERQKSNSVISVDFESAISKAGCGKFNFFMLLIALPASCSAAFVTGTMSYVIPVAGADLGLTPTTKALLQSASYIGMISSALIWGVLSDALGRQRLLAVGFLLDFTMNTLCALIPTLPTVVIFKILSGMMVCGPYSIFMTYLSEVFNDKSRSFAVLSAGLFSHTGSVIHSALALALIPAKMPDWLPLKSWQVFILCCGTPALLSGIGYSFTVESPKFLLEKGKPQKALEVCKTIYTINTGRTAEMYPVSRLHQPKETQAAQKTSVRTKVGAALAILKPPFVLRLLMMFCIQLCLAVTMNTLRLWLPEMLTVMSSATSTNATTICPLLAEGHKAQAVATKIVSKSHVYTEMMVVNACCFLGQLTFMVLVKFLGKKWLLMGASAVGACGAAMIPHIEGRLVFIPSAVVIAALNTSFYGAIGLIVEIFPTSVRATGVSLQMMVGRIGTLLGNFAFAGLIYINCEGVFYSLAALASGILVTCLFLSTTPIKAPNT